MTPSVEFSTGTTPKWVLPDCTSRKTSSIAASGTVSTPEPKCLSAASCVNVPAGPRKAILSGDSSARHAAQDVRFALGTIELLVAVLALYFRDRLRALRAFDDQRLNLFVERIDFGT